VKAKSRFSKAKGKRRGIEGPPRVAEARATPAIAGNTARPVRAEPIYTPYAFVLHSCVVTVVVVCVPEQQSTPANAEAPLSLTRTRAQCAHAADS
jgi:hypothetical protein